MDHNVQVIIANVDPDCDGIKTDLIRFHCPSSVISGLPIEDMGAAAARYIKGLTYVYDPTEWHIINDGSQPEAEQHIDPTGWWHHSGLDFQTVKGNIFQ